MKKGIKLSQQQIFLILILLIGFSVRLYAIGTVPGGLNQDEASSGYEAFSILYYGIDRNGIANPVHLLSWGSGQNIAYSWLCMPFIAVMGLSAFSIRIPMALIGCVSVVMFYILIKELWDKNSALIAALFFADYPWHIIKSR